MEATVRLKQAVREYKEGNAEAFTTLYEESYRYIYTCIYKILSENDNAQDIISDMMQDTYVEISRSIGQLENEEDDTFDTLSDSNNIIPEEVMQDKEKQRLIREIIEKELTEMQKLCIIAYYYNEQKQSEIARELGIPENTVKTNLSKNVSKVF